MNDNIAELLREGIDRLPADPAAPARLAEQARRRNRQRRSALAAGAAAGTAAAATAAVLFATASGGGGGAVTPSHATLTGYVASRMERALSPSSLADTVSITIAQATTVSPRTVSWSYRNLSRQEYFGKTGLPTVDTSQDYGTMRPGGTARDVTVDYMRRTWSAVSMTIGSFPAGTPAMPSSACQSEKAPPGYAGPPLSGFQATPSYLKATVACGALAADGHAVIDGVDTIKLTSTAKSKAGPMTVYVSPGTYLPVRSVVAGQRTDYQWRPATSANVAQLRVPIPAGFHRTASEPSTLGNDEG